MNLVNKVLSLFLIIMSLNAYSQDYVFATLKPGVIQDLESLISDPNNFVNGTDKNGKSIAYLKYTDEISKVFTDYSWVKTSNVASDDIDYQEELISVAEKHDYTYLQCVQFVRALSNAKGTNTWQSSGKIGNTNSAYLNRDMYLKWRIIAKFKTNGKYWQDGDPKPYGHVAIAIGSNSNGVYVIDQNWEGDGESFNGKVALHLIPWSEAKKYNLLSIPK